MKFLRTSSSCILSLAIIMSNISIVNATEEEYMIQDGIITQQSYKALTLTAEDIDCDSTKIIGTGLPDTKVVAKVGGKEIGSANVNKRGRYEISIPRQNAYTKIVISTVRYANIPPKTITVGFTIDGKIKSTSTTISGKGAVNAEVKAYVGNKQIGKTAKVNSDGKYKLSIPKQKTNTIITVQMSKSGVKLKNKTTVVSFENPAVVEWSMGKFNVIAPTSNLNLIIEPSVKTAVSMVNPYLGAGLVVLKSTYSKPINKEDMEVVKDTFSEVYEATKEYPTSKIEDKVLKSLDLEVLGSTLSYYSNIKEVGTTFNEIKSKLDCDTTDYELNKIYQRVMAGSVRSHTSEMAIEKYNFAKSVLYLIRESGHIKLMDKDKNTYYVSETPEGKKKLEDLRLDLHILEVEHLKNKYQNYEPTIKPVLYNDTTINGLAIPGMKVTATINGKSINTVEVNSNHSYSIKIPKQPVGTEIKLQFIGNEYYNLKASKYYDKTMKTIVGKANINKLTANKIYSTSSTITGNTIAGAEVKAYIGKSLLGKSIADKNGNYKISIKKQAPGTSIVIEANKKNYTTKSLLPIKVLGKIGTLTVNNIYEEDTKITGKSTNGATIKAYVDGTRPDSLFQIGNTTKVDKNGNYSITIPKKSAGLKIYIKASMENYEVKEISTKILKKNKIDILTVNKVYKDTTVLSGKTLSGAEVKAYVNKKQIGKTSIADKNGNYKLTIPKQAIGKTIEIKSNKKNYIPKSISVKVQNNQTVKKLYPFIKNEKVGYMDQNGNVIIKPKFNYFYDEHDDVNYAGEFYDGIAIAYTNDERVRYINTKGEYITNQIYDWGWDFSEGLAVVIQNGKYKYIDKAGKVVIDKNFDQCWEFSEGLAVIESNGKYGYINKKGEIVIKPQYQEARNFTNGYAIVTLNNKSIIIDKKGNNKTKNILIEDEPHVYSRWQPVVGEGLFLRCLQGKYVFADINNPNNIKIYKYKSGNNYIGYDEAYLFDEGLAPVSINGKWGCVDTNGKLVIPMKFDWIEGFKDGLSVASLNNKNIVINKSGKVVGKLPNGFLNGYLRDKIFQMYTLNGYEYYNLNGNKINIKI